MKFSACVIAAFFPVAAFAAPLELTPASPQPSGLSAGLAVSYAYPSDVKTLADARSALDKRAKAGPALSGLSYQDTKDGGKVMTSRFSTNVAAQINGYIRFDAAGIYTMNVWSNDGIEAWIGGQEIAFYDDRHPCEPAGEVQVSVPQAGWYALEALYFQRQGTACLMMEWGSGSDLKLVPDAAFGH